jgi:hypothetical protein
MEIRSGPQGLEREKAMDGDTLARTATGMVETPLRRGWAKKDGTGKTFDEQRD